ncbi:polyhydroxyalkanoate synthesis regulator DNA-binding domain-containing protein [Myxococcota bacterium]|nr:polyhydroxyalkanoate synthesis regulator DNA-binding domain-containing protein [Myxococcota bacterium]
MRIIKRYANRKLYDTNESRYVTLEQLAQMIHDGEALQIIDNTTKEDLTAVTMAQILVEQEKRQRGQGALPNLRELISRRITEPVSSLRLSVEESVHRLLRSGEERAVETREQFQAWIDQNTLAFEELQRRVDERVKVALHSLDPLGRTQDRVEQLEARVKQLEARLKQLEGEDEA